MPPPPRTQPKAVTSPASGVELESNVATDDAERYHWINGRELLTVPVRSEQGGVYGWVERKVLAPEVIHFKKVLMTGSMVAAIKRKNPLCLLQPAPFFDMDW